MTRRQRREKQERDRTMADTAKRLDALSKREAEEMRRRIEAIPDDVWRAAEEQGKQEQGKR